MEGKFAEILGPPPRWSWFLFSNMKNIWFAGIFGPLSCTFLIMSAAQEKGSKDRLFWCTGCKFGLLPFIDLFPDFTKLSPFDIWVGRVKIWTLSDFLVFKIIWWLSCTSFLFEMSVHVSLLQIGREAWCENICFAGDASKQGSRASTTYTAQSVEKWSPPLMFASPGANNEEVTVLLQLQVDA